ncbi:MAG: hypothetical protein EA425_06640 [Puniceicoccaceae bacterium]|nr:MAG: hypothetical protein EA425_06640 [Puniceicoccaceae bacterium]
MLSRLLAALLLSHIAAFGSVAQVKIILDTDFGGDADDLGALVMLHNLKNRGECELLAIMSWQTERSVIPAMDAVNRFYGNPDIPMAIRHRNYHSAAWNYSKPLADALPHRRTNDDVPLAVDLYRKILSRQVDQSVTIVTVGPLKNIKDLLQSDPDVHSELPGRALIERKVKQFVIMGGHFPRGQNEWNFNGGMPGVTRYVLEHLNVPIVFSGFEVGVRIKTGAAFNRLDPGHPLHIGFSHFSKHAPWMKRYYRGRILDNASYDQTAVLYAVRGGVGKYWDRVEGGRCVAEENGDNHWVEGEVTNHSYLVLRESPAAMAALITAIMLDEF